MTWRGRAARARVAHRLGRRGAFLTGVGLGWVYYGAGLIATPTDAVRQGLTAITGLVPLCALGWLWIVCGLVAVVHAWWPAPRDRFGFVGIVAPPVTWWAAYQWSWLAGTDGWTWPGGWTWLVWVVVALIVAGWAEPVRTGEEGAGGRAQ